MRFRKISGSEETGGLGLLRAGTKGAGERPESPAGYGRAPKLVRGGLQQADRLNQAGGVTPHHSGQVPRKTGLPRKPGLPGVATSLEMDLAADSGYFDASIRSTLMMPVLG